MKLGFIILAHEAYEELSPLLDTLCGFNDEIVFHFDQSSKHKDTLNKVIGNYNVIIPKLEKVEWGEASIVNATLNSMELFKDKNVDYVILLSGSCFPIKSRDELVLFLEKNRGCDFIDCHDVSHSSWVTDGLEKERWEYYHYLNWRKNKRLFTLSAKIQKTLKIKRDFIGRIKPMMGSQWWCLQKSTISSILDFTEKNNGRKFISNTWIPDEFYIQSLVYNQKKATPELIKPQLTSYKFNSRGIPKIYSYSDINEIKKINNFFIRKINNNDIELKIKLKNVYIKGEKLPNLAEKKKIFKCQSLVDDSISSFMSPKFIFIKGVNNKRIINNLIEKYNILNVLPKFFGELYSSSIVESYGLFEPSLNISLSDVRYRDYSLKRFTYYLNKSEGNGFSFISDINDFDMINYLYRDSLNILYFYLFDKNNTCKDEYLDILRKSRYLKTIGIELLLIDDIDRIIEIILDITTNNRWLLNK